MKKIISFMCIFGAIGSAESVQMTPQIQRLLEEKQAKIAELEKCDKNRKAFVIAGVSTLGLTAVGIGGNIALAQKNKKLDAELTAQKSVLTQKQGELSALQAKKEQERIDQAKKDCEQKSGFTWDGSACVPQPPQQVQLTIKNVVGTDCGQGDKTGILEIDDTNGSIDCTSVPQTQTDVWHKHKCICKIEEEQSAMDKCLASKSTPEGKACCYLKESVAKWEDGACKCQAENTEFKIENGIGKCVEKTQQQQNNMPFGIVIVGEKCGDADANFIYKLSEQGTFQCRASNFVYGIQRCECAPACESELGYNEQVVAGCTCDTSKGLISRFYAPNGTYRCMCADNMRYDYDQEQCTTTLENSSKSAATDIGVVPLDPYINGTDYTSNAAAMTWTTIFPYGNVSGIAVCNDTGGTYGVSSDNEQYETGGVKCWCKMTHPAVSRWVFERSHSSASGCAGGCANACGFYVRVFSDFRSGVFGSVAQ